MCHLGKVGLEGAGERSRRDGEHIAAHEHIVRLPFDDAEDPVRTRVEAVVTQLVSNKRGDQQETADAERQTQDVESAVELLLPHGAEGDLEVVFEHGGAVLGAHGRL